MQNDDDRPDMSSGTEWTQDDLTGLSDMLLLGESVEEIASVLCRRREVHGKLAELADACKPQR